MMANVEAQIKQSNGPLIDIDDNNNRNHVVEVASPPKPTQPPPQPSPPPPASKPECSAHIESFAETFKQFAKFGDSKSAGDSITLTNSDKWFKQAKIIDGKTITTTDTGIYFKQVAKTKRTLTLKEYTAFLDKLATVKKIQLNEIKEKLRSTGPPATNKTTTAMTSGAIGRLTDHTKYTGSHKQRFDAEGKGRGLAGR